MQGVRTSQRRMLRLIMAGPERVFEENMFGDLLDPVDRVVFAVIDEHRKRNDLAERDDILSMLMLAKHDDGTPMSDQELRDELMTLLLAGHETTATSVSWAISRRKRQVTESSLRYTTFRLSAIWSSSSGARPIKVSLEGLAWSDSIMWSYL